MGGNEGKIFRQKIFGGGKKKRTEKDYEEFLDEIRIFKKKISEIPFEIQFYYDINSSEFYSALEDHVENTINNKKVDQGKFWGLLHDENPEQSQINTFISNAFFNLGYSILESVRKENPLINEYLRKSRNLRF